jgi:8-oxo-dGTP pyrophosphatase MutT (NUDIX family)
MTRKERQIQVALQTGTPIQQVAALPWRIRPANGRSRKQREILLVTSRRRGRLILPKGWPMQRRTWPEAAEIEALEEAGVCGRLEPVPVGHYRTTKRTPVAEVPVLVTVYPLQVDRLLPRWKEAADRTRLWVPAEEAALLVEDAGLSGLLRQLTAV